MKLKPGIGIGDVKFGMTQEEVVKILGEPDRIRDDSEDENKLYLEYNEHKLRLTIYVDEEARLGYMMCSNPALTFNEEKIIDRKIEDAYNHVFSELVQNWLQEEYDTFYSYGDEEYWITLNVEYGRILALELGVPFNEDEEYQWPS